MDENEAYKMVKGRGKKKIGKIILTIFLILIFLGAIASAGWFGKKYYDLKRNPQNADKEEISALKNDVGNLIQIPSEEPTMATVLDKEKLKDQSFFKNAENGDKVLIFTNEKKAILYRPSTKKIIKVGPISYDNSGAQSSNTTTTAMKTK
ncbi:MAG: Uncharacterized protein CEN91_403 [Candidatus Berkelbacteria bacterium Licking1014_85]|uniref:Uncharacterized protein n=1 Tax=Candidatus Berkelbacteria bacterium Licking1014_85 TaxID=2017148 RepID=A0A554LI76_9BACT|nr:MAG: Uncharacterized protein CEN91_403 [Candidatus Berkelbacteria bacterium Licking1014_85]